jgi:hypothetical protein
VHPLPKFSFFIYIYYDTALPSVCLSVCRFLVTLFSVRSVSHQRAFWNRLAVSVSRPLIIFIFFAVRVTSGHCQEPSKLQNYVSITPSLQNGSISHYPPPTFSSLSVFEEHPVLMCHKNQIALYAFFSILPIYWKLGLHIFLLTLSEGTLVCLELARSCSNIYWTFLLIRKRPIVSSDTFTLSEEQSLYFCKA